MDQRVTLITLGVADLAAAVAFYARLGWRRADLPHEQLAVFDLGGPLMALFPRDLLAEDAGVAPEGQGFSGVTLACNQPDAAAVDRVIADAVAAGARLTRPARLAPWGGYSGTVADPDGHLWEIAFNPVWPLDGAGWLRPPEG